MKKLVIFLILVVFSMPVYAQDESSFLENFSLIRDSGDDNQALCNSMILVPTNYLFLHETKGYSKRHRAFQIFRSQRSSDQTSLSRVTTVRDGWQNLGNKYDLIYGQIYRQEQNINSEEKTEPLAEGYLKRLAHRSKKSRKTWGTIWLIGGGVYLGLGVALLSSEDEGDWIDLSDLVGAVAIASGAGMAGIGIYKWAVPSGAEREFDDVLNISGAEHRERASHEALSSLAARGRRRRIFWGIIWTGLSALTLFSEGGSALIAAEYGAFAVYNIMIKSRAERAFQSYLKEKEFQNRLEFRVGILPYGGAKVELAYSF
ncbi:MAG: hypothetical protein GTO16_01570 [Candidatus Aminicenantes bacterium]|nr:hypothetical protein [Candidatus Aminicenantes bacterium]